MNNTDILNLFTYGFFALAGATVLLAIGGVIWLAATGQLLASRPTTEHGTPVTTPAHDGVGVQAEEMPEIA